MKDLGAFALGFLIFVATTGFMWLGRHALGESTTLTLSVVAGYLLSFIVIAPAKMDEARGKLTAFYTAWKGK